MIFLLDNYDSFTYNLYQMLLGLGEKIEVARNDQTTVEQVVASEPRCIIHSPGPGRPEDAGIMMELIAATAERIPQLGVCLGMQGLGMHFGSEVVAAKELMHGKICKISHDGAGVFTGIELGPEVMRYHSLALAGLPEGVLLPTAHSDDGELMAFRHSALPIVGLQFHPESFATPDGVKMMENFLANHV